MAILPIRWAPDPVLKEKCTPVETVDSELQTLIDDMLDTMYAAPGIGLAAPQVGVTKRLLVADVSEGADRDPHVLINPEIIAESDELNTYEEGCLSIPSHYAEVERPAEVTVRFLDREGNQQEKTISGLLATCVQHEMDHLNGTLFVDHLSSLKRNMILRKMVKAKKTRSEDEAA